MDYYSPFLPATPAVDSWGPSPRHTPRVECGGTSVGQVRHPTVGCSTNMDISADLTSFGDTKTLAEVSIGRADGSDRASEDWLSKPRCSGRGNTEANAAENLDLEIGRVAEAASDDTGGLESELEQMTTETTQCLENNDNHGNVVTKVPRATNVGSKA